MHLNIKSLSRMLADRVDGDGGVAWTACKYYKALQRAAEVCDQFSYTQLNLQFLTSTENLDLVRDGASIMEMVGNTNLLHDKISIEFCQAMSYTNINVLNELINIAQVNEMFAFISISHHMVLILGVKTCVAMYAQSHFKGRFIEALKEGCYKLKLKIPIYVAIRITIKGLGFATRAIAFYYFANGMSKIFVKEPPIPHMDLPEIPQIELPEILQIELPQVPMINVTQYDLPIGIKEDVEAVTANSAKVVYHTTRYFHELVKAFRLGALGPDIIELINKSAKSSSDLLASLLENLFKKGK